MMTSGQLPITISIIGAVVAATSLLVASFSAFTSFRALRHSRRTSYTQLRPWDCYEETGIDVLTDPSGQRRLAFHVKWKNAGSTPARVGEVIALGMSFPTEELARAHTFEGVEPDPNISGLIGPGITLNSPTGMFRLEDF